MAEITKFIIAHKTTGEIYLDNAKKMSLSKNEVLLFELFYNNPGIIFSADDISVKCWPGRIVSPSSVPVSIKRVRDMLKKLDLSSKIITHKGIGYSYYCNDNINATFSEGLVDIDISTEMSAAGSHRNGLLLLIAFIILASCFLFSSLEWNEITSRFNKDKKALIISNSSNESVVNINTLNPGDVIFIDKSNHSILCNEDGCLPYVKK